MYVVTLRYIYISISTSNVHLKHAFGKKYFNILKNFNFNGIITKSPLHLQDKEIIIISYMSRGGNK